jgi:hypothetical protein
MIGRYKTLIGSRLRARGFAAQQTEAAIGVAVLNRMLPADRPDSVRRQPVPHNSLGSGPSRPQSGSAPTPHSGRFETADERQHSIPPRQSRSLPEAINIAAQPRPTRQIGVNADRTDPRRAAASCYLHRRPSRGLTTATWQPDRTVDGGTSKPK